MYHPTFKQLKYLVAVSHNLHFGKAAKDCYVSQSTLSSGIQELEKLLKIKLIERTKRNVLLTPLGKQIAENAGASGAVIAGKLLESKGATVGYNADTGAIEDLVKAGIIDPTKVVRTALQDASSVAGLLITTEAMVAEAPDDKAAAAPPMPDMGGMGGMGGMM